MRIGLMGGTFDPIHNGHLSIARQAMQAARLEKVLFIPSGRPPHKKGDVTAMEHRLAMTTLAISGEMGMAVSDIEIRREGMTYSIDTLRALQAQQPADYFFILGSDALLDFPSWRAPEQVVQLCQLLIFLRPGIDYAVTKACIDDVTARYGARIHMLTLPVPDVSSSMLRERVHEGLALDGLVPESVRWYIDENRLYAPPGQYALPDMQAKLKAMLSEERYAHSIGTMEEAVQLAQRFGAPVEAARIAGLLHDCAKSMPLEAMLATADYYGIQVDEQRLTSTQLLHAPLGAAMLRREFGVTAPEIIRAVQWHNTGTIHMGILDMIVYLADKIERTRDYPDLADVRALAKKNLKDAVILSMRLTLAHLARKNLAAHPDTQAAYDALIKDNPIRGDKMKSMEEQA